MKLLKRPSILINVILTIVFTIHVLVMAHQMFNPEVLSMKTYKKHFTEVEFPLVFRICAYEIQNTTVKFQKYGYKNDFWYYNGQSMYNSSLFGWNGHTKDGKTIASYEGR